VVTPPTVAPAPAPAPKPTPAPPSVLPSQFSIVSTFDELELFAGPDHNFWDSWKSKIEIRRNGKPSVLVAQGGGTRFTEEGKVTNKILEIKGPEFEFAVGAADDIETVILEDGGTRWEITTKPPVAPKLPAGANLKWIPGEAVFEFTGKAREAIDSYKLHPKQSLSFKLDFQEPSPEMKSIPVLKGRTESRKPFLDGLRQQVSAKLEEDSEYAGIMKELKEIEDKERGLQRLEIIPEDIKSAKQNKDNKRSGELESEQRTLEMKPGLLLLNTRDKKKQIEEARSRIAKEKEIASAKQKARGVDFEKSRSAAETLLKPFESPLPYGGVGKVYIVPSGGGSAGLKEAKPIFEIVAP
jgi:hypothetical protein